MLLLFATLFACGHDQTEACARYVDCVAAWDEQTGRHTDVARFAPGGACWAAAAEGVESCDLACENGLAWLADRLDEPPPECL